MGYESPSFMRHREALARHAQPVPEPDWQNVTVEEFATMSNTDRNKLFVHNRDLYGRLRDELDDRHHGRTTATPDTEPEDGDESPQDDTSPWRDTVAGPATWTGPATTLPTPQRSTTMTIFHTADDLIAAMTEAAETGLNRVAHEVAGVAVDRAPLRDGDLRSSLTPIPTHHIHADQPTSAVGSDLPYAVRQHEDLSYRHDDGQAKFLETAALDIAQSDFEKILATAVHDRMKN
ncbi:hypothetical protein ON058_00440 [Demequina sp. B12]|uniref:hypothetical protein n=1 Tax=Demequina sp. B12 TaxID=2992757 RepID=UPI00237A3A97|nr:hypothetical protein [Demequina sp. B12]MDE0571882.1 hypothetical protein [Demequina sp. B12]